MKVIVCSDTSNGIGLNGKLIYRIKEDLERFKLFTSNGDVNIVIMGRKTYESIGKSLPGRLNIVLSRDKSYYLPDAIVVNSVLELSNLVDLSSNENNVFLIGGSEIYKLFEEYTTKIYKTTVLSSRESDSFYKIPDNFIKTTESSVLTSRDGIRYKYETFLKYR